MVFTYLLCERTTAVTGLKAPLVTARVNFFHGGY